MGIETVKKSSSKSTTSSAATRRSASKVIKEEQPSCPLPTPKSAKRKPAAAPVAPHTHRLPSAERRKGNGRVCGRSLIVWGRPRMAEKLLLHLQYECARHKVALPMDAIAHRLHPGSSGAAVTQHLNRLRKELVAEGHLVPPVPCRPGSGETADPEIRGYIRNEEEGEGEKVIMRPVKFDEHVEDRKFSIPSVYNLEEAESEATEPCTPGSSTEEEQAPESPTPVAPRPSHPPTASRRGLKRARCGTVETVQCQTVENEGAGDVEPPRRGPKRARSGTVESTQYQTLESENSDDIQHLETPNGDVASGPIGTSARLPGEAYGVIGLPQVTPPMSSYGPYGTPLGYKMDRHGLCYGSFPFGYPDHSASFPQGVYDYPYPQYVPWGPYADPRMLSLPQPGRPASFTGALRELTSTASQAVDRADDAQTEASQEDEQSSDETQLNETEFINETEFYEPELFSDSHPDGLLVQEPFGDPAEDDEY